MGKLSHKFNLILLLSGYLGLTTWYRINTPCLDEFLLVTASS